jgi:pimeloyl-ACP methyl ester carboxylesterase
MEKQEFLVRGRRIAYTDQGKGMPVVLLHGFTESLDIWDDYSHELSPTFRVICVDLPGHGHSECVDEVHSMDLMAEVVLEILDKLGVSDFAILGHSMGGYVSLAVAEKQPERIKGLCLFHSTAAADSEEARENRSRTIEFVRNHRISFLSSFIPNLFAEASRSKFPEQIAALVERSKRMSAESIIAAQTGMRDRPDRTRVLKEANYPVLFMLGKEDSRIPYESALPQVALPQDAVLLSMGGTGHMGYIEARDKCLYALRVFLEGL